jgi:hypothetical protein
MIEFAFATRPETGLPASSSVKPGMLLSVRRRFAELLANLRILAYTGVSHVGI